MFSKRSWLPRHLHFPNFAVVNIVNTPTIIVKFILALINISQKFIDSIINLLIDKLIKFGLYEPRLTVLINELESMSFASHPLLNVDSHFRHLQINYSARSKPIPVLQSYWNGSDRRNYDWRKCVKV